MKINFLIVRTNKKPWLSVPCVTGWLYDVALVKVVRDGATRRGEPPSPHHSKTYTTIIAILHVNVHQLVVCTWLVFLYLNTMLLTNT